MENQEKQTDVIKKYGYENLLNMLDSQKKHTIGLQKLVEERKDKELISFFGGRIDRIDIAILMVKKQIERCNSYERKSNLN